MSSKVRRQQDHLNDGAETINEMNNGRGGPKCLDDLKLQIISHTDNYIVLNKGADERLDGSFDVTIEKALHRDYPTQDKFRWIHQLDFATSGILCIGLTKQFASLACQLFREKRVQKEYLALVHGYLPFIPQKQYSPLGTCCLSKLPILIEDIELYENYLRTERGSHIHQRHPRYPKGPRPACNLYEMEIAKLKRETNGKIVNAELHVVWKDLSAEKKQHYKELAKNDHQRFRHELKLFLDRERSQLIQRRQYNIPLDLENNYHSRVSINDEPIAYIFDDPIFEPDGDGFKMAVGQSQTNTSNSTLSGKASTTIAFVLGHGMYQDSPVTKVLLRPLSGRRHQLRLHLSQNGYPIVGDVTYGLKLNDSASRMMLHAWKLWLMPSPKEQKKYGNLKFTSNDPFRDIVTTQQNTDTMNNHI